MPAWLGSSETLFWVADCQLLSSNGREGRKLSGHSYKGTNPIPKGVIPSEIFGIGFEILLPYSCLGDFCKRIKNLP